MLKKLKQDGMGMEISYTHPTLPHPTSFKNFLAGMKIDINKRDGIRIR